MTEKQRTLLFTDAIKEALFLAMEADPSVICYGLGVTDPKGIFGTTLGLEARFGENRVFDMPTSENALTGIGIGASLNGIRPVMIHQRLDFSLLAMDQLVNNASKWFYMFGGQDPVPLTIRLVVGRGWGQGPTHSQSLHAWFAHVPGLKVLMPTTPADAKGLLLSAVFDDNPVVYIEHRWLHFMQGEVPSGDFRIPIGKGRLAVEGHDVTIVSMSYMSVEALHAVAFLEKAGIRPELIDLRTLKPIDWDMIFRSVRKTGHLLVLDTGPATGSIAGEIVSRVATDCFADLKTAPIRLAMPDVPVPTSTALTKDFYPRAEEIAETVGRMVERVLDTNSLKKQRLVPHDVPGEWFMGPF